MPLTSQYSLGANSYVILHKLLGDHLVNIFRINQPSNPDYKIQLFHKPENPSSTIRAKVMNILKASLLGTISFATMHYNTTADAQHRITLR